MADSTTAAALDGAAQDLRDEIASAALLGVSEHCRKSLREHADAAIALHRREIDAQHRLVEGLQHRLKLAQEERDRAMERLQAALDERDDAEAAHASAVAQMREQAARSTEAHRRRSNTEASVVLGLVDQANVVREQLTRALDLLARLRPGEPRSWPALCQFQEEIDTLMAECRGEKP